MGAAKRGAEKVIRKGIEQSVNPIYEEVKKYIIEYVSQLDIPNIVDHIWDYLEEDGIHGHEETENTIKGIIEKILENTTVYQTYDGLSVNILMEDVELLAQQILGIVRNSVTISAEVTDFFEKLEIDTENIKNVVINQIKSNI